jgi:hypothetical protein
MNSEKLRSCRSITSASLRSACDSRNNSDAIAVLEVTELNLAKAERDRAVAALQEASDKVNKLEPSKKKRVYRPKRPFVQSLNHGGFDDDEPNSHSQKLSDIIGS